MKLKPALIGAFIAAQLGVCVAFGLDMSVPSPAETSGQAFVTQNSSTTSSLEYDTAFGDNWESVRTFRLLKPLDKPLKVYIETHPANAALYRPHYRDYIIDGLHSWSQALDGRLSFVLTNRKKDADITVDWVNGFSDRYVAGITNYSVGHAGVEIKTVNVPDKDIKCNIIHELGHALGISGHSTDPGDIMVGVRRWHRDNTPYDPKLSQRDIQAIRRLYSATWSKGEDLYSATAQQMPMNTLANRTTQPPASVRTILAEPAHDEAMLSVKSSQARVQPQPNTAQPKP